ncbi:hypothetical protein BTH42_29880 [Burkholderia sp. SRS-W-2-2016]|uniref:hypothetical protein n=1 Tax=Burkholderia sp. SRS-W-2-2016 TaxID=1926878 RepID=UPI00094B63E8|nr:hypothetical protein [Burkholderia sp. SRS-W-2-2016]OLL28000.1 hypothetical protein BTH42_29880 [Burkholderia sp. SRS-W-2-2016]
MSVRIEDVLADAISVSSEIRVRSAALVRMEQRLGDGDEPLLREALATLRRELTLLQRHKGELMQRLQVLETGLDNFPPPGHQLPTP